MKKNGARIFVFIGTTFVLFCIPLKAAFPSAPIVIQNIKITPPENQYTVIAITSGAQLQAVLNQQIASGLYYRNETGIFSISGKSYVLFSEYATRSENNKISPAGNQYKVVAIKSGTHLQGVLNQQIALGWYYRGETGIFTISEKSYVLFSKYATF